MIRQLTDLGSSDEMGASEESYVVVAEDVFVCRSDSGSAAAVANSASKPMHAS